MGESTDGVRAGAMKVTKLSKQDSKRGAKASASNVTRAVRRGVREEPLPPWEDVLEALLPTPTTAEELRAWLRTHAGIELPTGSMIEGHSSPLEYLAWSFFEGRGGADGWGFARPPSEPEDAVLWANRGGGKTFLGAVATLLDLIFKPGIEIRILGGSMDQSRRMHAHLRKLFSMDAFERLVAGKIGERRIVLRNGSEVELLAQSQASVRGTRVQKLRCDEVELFDRDVFEAAQLCTRSRSVEVPGVGKVLVRGGVECLSTMHVPFGLMHELVNEARQGERALFRWGVLDVLGACGEQHVCGPGEGAEGPRCALWEECRGRAKQREAGDAGHVRVEDAVRMKKRVALATWEAEMLSLRPRRTDAVLPEFEVGTHVVETPLHALRERVEMWAGRGVEESRVVSRFAPEFGRGCEVLCGMDFGLRGMTVVLWAVYERMGDGNAGRLTIVDERCRSGEVLQSHIEAMLEGRGDAGDGVRWPRPTWVGVDPAGNNRSDQSGVSNVQVMRGAGLEVRSYKRHGVPFSLNLLRARLCPAEGEPTLYVHRRCETLIKSLERYHYDPAKPTSLEPVKDGNDHAVDALRYLVVNLDARGGGTLERVHY